MPTSNIDIDMSSPPSSPTPLAHAHAAPQTITQPMPIPNNSTSSRFQPTMPSPQPSSFNSLSIHRPTFGQTIFKVKPPRQISPPMQHHPQPQYQPSSHFNPVPTSSPSPMSSPQLSTSLPAQTPPINIHMHSNPITPTPTAPVQIQNPNNHRSHPIPINLSLPSTLTIPQSLPNMSPSYPATLFGGLSAEDEHVTVWEPHTGKTVAGNAAPYRRNLSTWLKGHPGWEEKADELKSSKRRSAARRSRNAADAFAALCCYPVATILASEAANHLQLLGDGDHCNEQAMMMWTSDDFVRLQEALFRLGQQCHSQGPNNTHIADKDWAHLTTQIGGSKMQGTVVYCAHHMLSRGIAKSQRELAGLSLPRSFGAVNMSLGDSTIGCSPGSVGSFDRSSTGGLDSFQGPSSLPVGLGASFLEKSFRAPREPRVTVWNPSNGRTISGNAAPCRRNLETWMRQHPGWCPKDETQLSSSRRNRNRKTRPSSMPSGPEGGASSMEPESPHFHDALEGLLYLSKSPSAASPLHARTVDAQLEEQVARAEAEHGSPASTHIERLQRVTQGGRGGPVPKTLTSSVSSSSAEDVDGVLSDGEDKIIEESAMEL